MTSHRPWTIRVLEVASVAGFAVVCGALAIRLSSMSWEGPRMFVMCAGALLGYLVADVVSGLVHWFCDTFFHDDTPLIGPAFIHPFREHHSDPLGITRHGFFEVNGNNSLVLLPLVTAVLLMGEPRPGEAVPALFVQCTVLAFALVTFATNQFHKWAHQERPLAAVRWLQATGLILSPAHHGRHHSRPYRQAYCITAGWLDPVLDRTHLFERIEHAIRQPAADAAGREPSPSSTSAASRRVPVDRTPEH